ncbi:hypothetical protein GF385_01610 [Candidatus Dependentiae bacterium]|nr:hypothetical protein [Candidatus Dependentiae bacterium]
MKIKFYYLLFFVFLFLAKKNLFSMAKSSDYLMKETRLQKAGFPCLFDKEDQLILEKDIRCILYLIASKNDFKPSQAFRAIDIALKSSVYDFSKTEIKNLKIYQNLIIPEEVKILREYMNIRYRKLPAKLSEEQKGKEVKNRIKMLRRELERSRTLRMEDFEESSELNSSSWVEFSLLNEEEFSDKPLLEKQLSY